jgi:hypothetical protein
MPETHRDTPGLRGLRLRNGGLTLNSGCALSLTLETGACAGFWRFAFRAVDV